MNRNSEKQSKKKGFTPINKKIIYKKDNKTDYIVALIGHPKLIDDRYISNLIKFIELIKYDTRFSFISINEAYRMIRKS